MASEDDINDATLEENPEDTAALVQGEPRRRWWHTFERKFWGPSDDTQNENPNGDLDMLNGVILPVVLSMFSSLLFLRVGYIVGNAGLIIACVMLAGSYLVLGLTASSVSAIATNGQVQKGGVYFMISRTLGPQFGGSVGGKPFVHRENKNR